MAHADAETIRTILEGDSNAFGVLVRKYQDKVARLCSSILRTADCEDAVQEVFLKTYKSLEKFEGNSAFSTWLYRITFNHCLTLIAKRKSERTSSLDEQMERGREWAAEPEEKRHDSLEKSEIRQELRRLLDLLEPEQRGILILREVDGLSYKELSETLDTSVDAVKTRLFRARAALVELAKNAGLKK